MTTPTNLFTAQKEVPPQINIEVPLFEAICELMQISPFREDGTRNTKAVAVACRSVLWGAVKASRSNGEVPTFSEERGLDPKDLGPGMHQLKAARGQLEKAINVLESVIDDDLDLGSL